MTFEMGFSIYMPQAYTTKKVEELTLQLIDMEVYKFKPQVEKEHLD